MPAQLTPETAAGVEGLKKDFDEFTFFKADK